MFGTPQPANQNAHDEIAGRIEPYAQQHFADVYAGLELNNPDNRVRVFRVPSAAFDTWITGTFAEVCVELVDARHPAAELTALATRIADDFDYWRSVGVPIYSTSPLYDGSGVQVTTSDVTKARPQLLLRYGANAPIIVVAAEPVQPLFLVGPSLSGASYPTAS